MKKLVTSILAPSIALMLTSNVYAADTVHTSDSLSQISVNDHIPLNKISYSLVSSWDLFNELAKKKHDKPVFIVKDTAPTPSTTVTPSTVKPTVTNPAPRRSYAETDLIVLARLVEAEAGIESFAGKIAVAKTVMNRVASNEFPDTVTGVIYQDNQFETVSNGRINNDPSSDSLVAAKYVLETYKGDPDGYLYFCESNVLTSSWLRTRDVILRIGHQVFLR